MSLSIRCAKSVVYHWTDAYCMHTPSHTERERERLAALVHVSLSLSPPSPQCLLTAPPVTCHVHHLQAASPDEAALVSAVKRLGFSFNVRQPDRVVINALGTDESFEVLNVLEFNSTRKVPPVLLSFCVWMCQGIRGYGLMHLRG